MRDRGAPGVHIFWFQEGQEALYFEFQLNLTTLKFCPYVALSENFNRCALLIVKG